MLSLSPQFMATAHFLALGSLALYGLHRLWLLACLRRLRRTPLSPPGALQGDDVPRVTVQLPLYNERFVAGRLVDAAAKLDWPKDRLEIQVLDDSGDDTGQIVDERAFHWKRRGVDIRVFRRAGREGFKAGALAHGLAKTDSELVAVFDADFVPPADFLRRTVSHFSDPEVGMVQARWGFLNAGHSWLTRIQALLLGPHFRIEHQVRFRRGLFFNFNGTAGIWRRRAIEEAGGWQADTVTEDLDLSYRAQLAGWRFVYRDDVVVPSELPVTLAAFRSQQQRWAKGSVQTARKILPRILFSSQPPAVKLEAAAHLLANFGWLLGAAVTLTLYPTLLWRTGVGPYELLRLDLPLFLGATGAILLYFAHHALAQEGRKGLLWLPLLPVLTLGLAPSLALAVLQGTFRRGGVFERTPKFGLTGRGTLPGLAALYRQKALSYILLNGALLAYLLLPLLFAWQRETWIALPFLALFPVGFGLVLSRDFVESLQGIR
ncbi:MAG: glycosyl transferase family 2 [Desulfuromonas sp.]|uniref:cellulose synthase family protein n=1 Tax=Desulfuromonas sp. TaxID=892 RepID=UPI000CAA114C|nr:cellulose synthase family protein [Desulfuromonas sp.]PLX85916.1 MAG: glycosyl transferase family 2 [Desulfuromonas sp.]